MRKAILAAFAAFAVLMMGACGGSGNNPPPPPLVAVSPATANVQEASTQQFSATVSNTSQTAVTWQVNGITGGNATVGTIDSTGLYTAPAAIPNPPSVTVTAVLQANNAFTGNAIATITAVQFSNSSFKGNYIISVRGVDANGLAFYVVGAITADGNGNITGGEEDWNGASFGYIQAPSISGNYSVGADGRGSLNLNVPAVSSAPFGYAIAMKALNNAVVNEMDNQVVAATGDLELQTATGVAVPSGNYAFGFSGTGLSCGGSFNSAGIFAFNNAIIGGVQDLNCGGRVTQAQTLTGSFGGIDGLGRGTGQFSANSGSSNMVYYVVSASRFRFMCPDPATFFLGSGDLQTQPAFASSDFNGNYVVNTSASTNAGVSYTLIQFNASGGNISTGHYDVNDTGTVGQASVTGAYTFNANGRISGSFTVNNVALPFAMYLVSPTQAYYLDERTTIFSGGGNVYGQSGDLTDNAGWAGSYATKQFGYFVVNRIINTANATAISGQLSADGAGVLAGTLDINDPGGLLPNQPITQGQYAVGNVAPGRFTASITTNPNNDGTRNFVGYIVSPGQVVLMENDSNLTAGGDAVRQF